MVGKWLAAAVLVWLLVGGTATAANFRVNWVQELSSPALWRFELINESVDPLTVEQLTVTFYGPDGRRLWAFPVAISPAYLRSGDSGWVTLDVGALPPVRPLRIDWEATWNPNYVPVLPKYWSRELVASVEIDAPEAPDSSSAAPAAPLDSGAVDRGRGQAPDMPRRAQSLSAPRSGEI